jgi:hypothetical protein
MLRVSGSVTFSRPHDRIILMVGFLRRHLQMRQAEIARDIIVNQKQKEIERKTEANREWYWNAQRQDELPVDFEKTEAAHNREIEQLENEVQVEKDKFSTLQTHCLISEMETLGVPLPEGDEYWCHNHFNSSQKLLNLTGLHAFREAIRQERKERFEPIKDRVAITFGAGGLIVAMLTLILRIIETSMGG